MEWIEDRRRLGGERLDAALDKRRPKDVVVRRPLEILSAGQAEDAADTAQQTAAAVAPDSAAGVAAAAAQPPGAA